MQKLKNWLIVGSLTLGVGVTASVALRATGASGALLGSASGAVIGAAISPRRQDKIQQDKEIELQQLREKVVKQDKWEEINTELPILTVRVNELRKAQVVLTKVEVV